MSSILAFDTSGPHVAVAILQDGEISTRVEEMARGQGERLMLSLEELLIDASLDWAGLTALGVGVGPGNFTGIRISVAAARGLSLGLEIPAVGVSLFETTQALSGESRVAVPAPREQVYLNDGPGAEGPALAPWTEGLAIRSDTFTTAEHVAQIAKIAAERYKTTDAAPKPLYVKPADAAPPKDAPPVLID